MVKLEDVVNATNENVAACEQYVEMERRHQLAIADRDAVKKELLELEETLRMSANVDLSNYNEKLRQLRFTEQEVRTRTGTLDMALIEAVLKGKILQMTRSAFFDTKTILATVI